MRTNVGLLCVALTLSACASRGWPARAEETDEIVPVAVWSPTPTHPGQALGHLIDGDWATSCCLLDDTLTGTDGSTVPPRGAPPITARFVLDLGKLQPVDGLRLVAQKSWVSCMAANVTVFACTDREGRQNVRCLADNCRLPAVSTFNAAFVTWKRTATRYLGVRVNDGYARAAPRPDERWAQAIAKTPYPMREGFHYDLYGVGGQLAVEIAEVCCFRGLPADMPRPNPPGVACPENRLQRDWMYQDCGVENRSLVANSAGSVRPDPIGPDISRCFCSKHGAVAERAMVRRVLEELERGGVDATRFASRAEALASVPGADARWKQLYFDACRVRRQERLKAARRWAPRLIYAKHFIMGGGEQFGQTQDLSDEQCYSRTPVFRPGSQLCLATINPDGSVANEVLLEKPRGVIRDPCLSFDAGTLVFSMRDNFTTDDYHVYTMTLADRRVEQITFSPTVEGKLLPCCDIEPCFAPDGGIVFQSTRCGQLDDCAPHPTCNLYACDTRGRYVRRLAVDQVLTTYPQPLEDGRIIYTRWEYSDRAAYFQQSLFAMNPDGTAQTELYGNGTLYPTSLIHARGIPGSNKMIAVVSGHHVLQKGKLAIIDRSRGTEGNSGIEYVAGASPDGKPGRQPSRVLTVNPLDKPGETFAYACFDKFGHIGPQWQYPYAFDEQHYLVSFLPEGAYLNRGPYTAPFGVYFMTADGRRELLAFDWDNSCGQALPLMPTRRPPVHPSQVDWTKSSGTFYVQNVYAGPGLAGVAPGTVKRLRVVALEYRAAGISANYQDGPMGPSRANTPVAIDNGSQDVKHVLGEVDIEADGSVYVEVPARNAVYFQLLDARGRCVQTMRSWTMVQPGERAGCVGCHENKLQTSLATGKTPLALGRPARRLLPLAGQTRHPLLVRLETQKLLDNVDNLLGVNKPCSLDPKAPVDGFSYPQLVQPIWDAHCVACHHGQAADATRRSTLRLTGEIVELPAPRFRLGGSSALRAFTQSYVALTAMGQCTPLVNWVAAQSLWGTKDMLPPRACGSSRSRLMDYLEPGHYGVHLSDAERRLVACWIDLAVPFCGSYAQAHTWEKVDPHFQWTRHNQRDVPQPELYAYFQMKRVRFAQQEIENIKAWTAELQRRRLTQSF